jgi:hypothetical protein
MLRSTPPTVHNTQNLIHTFILEEAYKTIVIKSTRAAKYNSKRFKQFFISIWALWVPKGNGFV